MTPEEFEKLIPGQTILEANLNGKTIELLVKFYFWEDDDNGSASALCCTEDMTNPFPYTMEDEDWVIYINTDAKIKQL